MALLSHVEHNGLNYEVVSIDVKNEADGVVMLSTNKAKFSEMVSVYYRIEQYSDD